VICTKIPLRGGFWEIIYILSRRPCVGGLENWIKSNAFANLYPRTGKSPFFKGGFRGILISSREKLSYIKLFGIHNEFLAIFMPTDARLVGY